MPTSKDLFELFFMGPGLICVFFAIGTAISALWKAHRQRRGPQVAQAKQLCESAEKDLALGRLDEAVELCGRAIPMAKSDPETLTKVHLVAGRVTARLGDDAAAVEHLEHVQRTSDLDVRTELSLALRRAGRLEEALTLAIQAVESHRDPAAKADAGWAQAALAMAHAESGYDGRFAAGAALEIFRSLVSDTDPGAIEGLAFACYVSAFTRKPFADPAAMDLAEEAVDRFFRLSASAPQLYRVRLDDARRLAESLG